MAENNNFGASFSLDTTDLKAGLAQANKLIRESESEFRAAAAGMDDWSSSQEGLEARISSLNNITNVQAKKVEALKAQYNELVANGMNPASAEAVELRTKINNETTALNKNLKELDQQNAALAEMAVGSEEAADKVEDTGEAAEKASKGLSGLKKAAGIAVAGIAAITAAAAAAIGSFLSLAESTRETRSSMAKLETSFTTAGLSAENATDTYTALYGVLGDTGQATEAAAMIGQMAKSEEELANWADIATGVYATFGSSLPIESLAEASLETSKTGQLTGGLVDALNWAGASEEEFQAALDACSTEQERQALITDTLNGLYSEQSNKFKEVNADIIAAQEATANYELAMANLGAVAEPIMTTLKNMTTDLINQLLPFIEVIGSGLSDALNGTAGAAAKISEGLGGALTTVIGMASSVIPPILAVVAEIVPSIIQTLLEQLPGIMAAIVEFLPNLITTLLEMLPLLLETVITLVLQIIEGIAAMLPQIIESIMTILPMLINRLIAAIPQLLQAAITLFMAIVQAIPMIIVALVEALPSIIQSIIDAVLNSIPLLLDAAIQLLMAIIDAIPVIIQAIIENLPLIINTIIDGVIEALPLLLDAAVQLFMAMIDAIPVIIQQLLTNLPKIIVTIVNALVQAIPKILKAAKELFLQIINAIVDLIRQLPAKVGEIIKSIVGGLTNGIKDIAEAGKDLVRGIWDGISAMASWLWDKVSGFFSGIVDGVKDFFGINSPSKLFADEIGANLALGVGKGFTDLMPKVAKDINEALNMDDIGYNISGATDALQGVGGKSVVVNQYITHSAPTSRIQLWNNQADTLAAVNLALTTA